VRTTIERRIRAIEQAVGLLTESEQMTFTIHFVGPDRKVKSVLILGPNGRHEWKENN
jgi:hypothetical protein